jgi:hypothetical protein
VPISGEAGDRLSRWYTIDELMVEEQAVVRPPVSKMLPF